MTDTTFNASGATAQPTRRDIGLKRRYAAERRFRYYGIAAIAIGVFFLCALLFSVFSKGYTAFWQTTLYLPVKLEEKVIDPGNKRATDPNVLITANYPLLVRNALAEKLGVAATDRPAMRDLGRFYSDGVRIQLRKMVMDTPSLIGTTQTVPVLAGADRSLHLRCLQPSGNLRSRRRACRFALHDADRSRSVAAYRRRRFDLSGRVRQEEPFHRHD